MKEFAGYGGSVAGTGYNHQDSYPIAILVLVLFFSNLVICFFIFSYRFCKPHRLILLFFFEFSGMFPRNIPLLTNIFPRYFLIGDLFCFT